MYPCALFLIAIGVYIIVENKVGATGMVAATMVARARPDEYTLLVATNSSHGSNPAIYETLTYDPIADFAPVVPLAIFTHYLAVNPQLPVTTLQELVAYAKANPGKVSFATGSTTSLVTATTFAKTAGIDLLKVSYRSNPPAITDLIGGRVAMMFVDIPSAATFVKSGQLRAIAITSHARSALAPDLPTIQETVDPTFAIESWVGFLAPAKMPRAIVDKLNSEFIAVMKTPDVKEQLAALGADVMTQTPDELARFVAVSVENFTRLTKESGIEPQ